MLFKKICKNWTGTVTLIGVIAVCLIIFSGVDPMYVFIVLGGMNCLYGLYALITSKPVTENDKLMAGGKQPERYTRAMGACQIGMGIFLLGMGIIYVCNIVTGKYFWDIVLLGIVVLMACWYVIRMKGRN